MKSEAEILHKIAFFKELLDRKIHEELPQIQTSDKILSQMVNGLNGRMAQLAAESGLRELEWVLEDDERT